MVTLLVGLGMVVAALSNHSWDKAWDLAWNTVLASGTGTPEARVTQTQAP